MIKILPTILLAWRLSWRSWPLLIGFLGLLALHGANGQVVKSELPKEKQTTTGLYVTAKEAFERWKADPKKVKILDVRTIEEFLFVGHASMAWNIPVQVLTYQWDEDKKKFTMKPNLNFMNQVREVFHPDDLILVTCRVGGRGALDVNQMAIEGFKNVYNITDGMEGDLVNDPESIFHGQRLKNGWKNSGLPYTSDVDPKLMLFPKIE